jgi:hypothetical protein
MTARELLSFIAIGYCTFIIACTSSPTPETRAASPLGDGGVNPVADADADAGDDANAFDDAGTPNADDASDAGDASSASDGADGSDADPGYFDITRCEPADGKAPSNIMILHGYILDLTDVSAYDETFRDDVGWEFYGSGLGVEVGTTSRNAGDQYVAYFADGDGGVPASGVYVDAGSVCANGTVAAVGGAELYINMVPLAGRLDVACPSMTGSFYVKNVQWTYDHSAVQSFTASFQRYCSTEAPVLSGCVNYVRK